MTAVTRRFFGTGHSSLAYLKGLPVGEIKIDKSFVLSMLEDPDDLAIVQTIIDLAHNLRLSVLAEGVETADAGNRLLEMGCHGAQGYHYARPMPADEVIPWMERPRPARRRLLAPVASHASIA